MGDGEGLFGELPGEGGGGRGSALARMGQLAAKAEERIRG